MLEQRTVYAIQHNKTKRIYIGSSARPEARFTTHMSLLRHGKHRNEDMQQDYNLYGPSFSFFILDKIDNHWDREKEFLWMKKYESYIRGRGYNYMDRAAIKRFLGPQTIPYKEGLPEPPPEIEGCHGRI